MLDWPAKHWLKLLALVWSLACLLLARSQSNNIHTQWKQLEESSFRRSAISALRQIEVDPTIESKTRVSLLRRVEQEQDIGLTWLPQDVEDYDSIRSFHESSLDSKVFPTVLWSAEPNGMWRLQSVVKMEENENNFLRLHRIIDTTVKGSNPFWFLGWIWFVGIAIGYGLYFARSLSLRRVEEKVSRWSRSIQQQQKPVRSLPLETQLKSRKPVWNDFEIALKSIQEGMNHAYASSEQTAKVLDGMSEGVLAIDLHQRLVYCNPAARSLLDITIKNAIGRSLIEVLRQPRVIQLIEDAFQVDSNDEPVLIESELDVGGLSNRHLRLRAARLPKDSGTVALILTISDETQLKRLENLRREFTANVSHELKTPLAAIKAYSETLLMGALEDPNSNRRFVERISEQSSRLEALIQDLLKLASIQDSPKREMTQVHLASVVRQSVDCYSAIADAKRVSITLNNLPEEVLASTDREAVSTILNNLIGNAIRYTPSDGKVEIIASIENQSLTLCVSDTGIGIAKEDQVRIFERFYRVDKARTTDVAGTGLGLAIVKNQVAVLSGSVEVQSELGKGSTFIVRLPMSYEI